MRLKTWIMVAALAASAPLAGAQEPPKYDQLKQMYDETVKSLKTSQDAKNALFNEKEALAKQVAELQKQLDAITKERDELQRQATTYAERTFNLRSYYAAWQEFLKKYPALQVKWKTFLDAELLKTGNETPALVEPGWPFRVEG